MEYIQISKTDKRSVLVFSRQDLTTKGSADFKQIFQKVKRERRNCDVKVFFIKTENDFLFCFEISTDKNILQIDDSFELAYYYGSEKEVLIKDIFRFDGVVSFGNKVENQFSIQVNNPFIPKKDSNHSFGDMIKEMKFPAEVKIVLPLVAKTVEESETIF